jgi:hypothetical protein
MATDVLAEEVAEERGQDDPSVLICDGGHLLLLGAVSRCRESAAASGDIKGDSRAGPALQLNSQRFRHGSHWARLHRRMHHPLGRPMPCAPPRECTGACEGVFV